MASTSTSLREVATTRTRKLHWTKRPENAKKLAAMQRRSQATLKARRSGIYAKREAPKAKTKKAALLNELAMIGARVELDRLSDRIRTLKMFLRG